jgi:hypothetical protein
MLLLMLLQHLKNHKLLHHSETKQSSNQNQPLINQNRHNKKHKPKHTRHFL